MQEEVENRTISLIISGSKFTGRLLKAAVSKYLAHRKEVKAQKSRDHPEEHGGQVSMAELQAQKGDLRRLDISDPSSRSLTGSPASTKLNTACSNWGKENTRCSSRPPAKKQ